MLNKAELTDRVAASINIPKKEATQAVDAVFDIISQTLTTGEAVNIAGFGQFVVKKRAARKGINPKTKESIQIAASKAPAFKPGKGLKTLIQNS